MIIEIKGFAISLQKICSISPVTLDHKKRAFFDIILDNCNKHCLNYRSFKDAEIAREIIIKALDDKQVNVSDILKKVDAKANADTAKKAIDELLKELDVKDIAELKEICK